MRAISEGSMEWRTDDGIHYVSNDVEESKYAARYFRCDQFNEVIRVLRPSQMTFCPICGKELGR